MNRLPESIVCFKWTPKPGYRSTYPPETVNVLRRMVARHYPYPHRFICVTDNADGIDREVEIVPIWQQFADLPSPHGGKNPSCYRRLKAFAPDAAELFGERFVCLDLDCVITGEMTPLWDRPEDFVIWGDTGPKSLYNGSMFLLTAGARAKVWTDFDPQRSPDLALNAGHWGSDQGWISYCLGKGEARWSTDDGVYSYRNHIRLGKGDLPANCRICMFHGEHDPWSDYARTRHAWVREAYQ